jgi:hypothetical protein
LQYFYCCNVAANLTYCFGVFMQELNMVEVELVGGASTMGNFAAGMAGAASISGGLASVPTPASPALASFAVICGVLSAGAWYLDSHYPTAVK